MIAIGWVLLAYFLGSLPFAVWVARLRGRNVLREGSGNPGALNVRRVAGWSAGLAVLLLDIGKGLAAVALPWWRHAPWTLVMAAGVAVVAGHCFSPFLKFRGGRGIATSGGVLLLISPMAMLGILALGAVLMAIARKPEPAALAMIFTTPLFLWAFEQSPALNHDGSGPAYLVFSLALVAVVALKHGEEFGMLREALGRAFKKP